jgi:hypothetical protein
MHKIAEEAVVALGLFGLLVSWQFSRVSHVRFSSCAAFCGVLLAVYTLDCSVLDSASPPHGLSIAVCSLQSGLLRREPFDKIALDKIKGSSQLTIP